MVLLFLRRGFDRREAILAALIVGGTIVVALTEFLSVIQGVDATALSIGWWISAVVVTLFLVILPKICFNPSKHESIGLTAKIFMAGIAAIFVLSVVLAVGTSANTWDAMTYHLSRVEHWVQNKTIAYYPTHIVRQDAYPPWAEWGILHLRLLSGGDYFSGILQCVSMIASTIGVSLIARWLGAGLTGQSLAALLSACLPMGILQATSTQNDYVVTMWLVSFVYFLLNSMYRRQNLSIFLAALSLGLAFLTKGYAYLYATPFLIWWTFANTSKSWSYRGWVIFLIVGIALLLNEGYFYRNGHAFGRILWANEQLVNGKVSLSIWLANLLRNALLHVSSIYVPYNEWLTGKLQDLAVFLHIDLNPAQGTFGTQKFELTTLMFNEDYAGNFLSVLIFIFILIMACIKFFQGQKGLQWAYAGAVGGMFLLLCLLLRFQIFNSRFHLAVFVLGSAWTAFVIEKILSKQWVVVVGLLVLVAATPWFVFNHNKSLFQVFDTDGNKRIKGYFSTYPSWVEPVAGLSSRLSALGCRDIGLITNEDSKEYLLWMTLHWYKSPPARIEHVDVSNVTGALTYPLGKFNPCAVALLSVERPTMIVLPSGIYGRVWFSEGQQGDGISALYVPVDLKRLRN